MIGVPLPRNVDMRVVASRMIRFARVAARRGRRAGCTRAECHQRLLESDRNCRRRLVRGRIFPYWRYRNNGPKKASSSIVDRKKRMILSGGFNVYPADDREQHLRAPRRRGSDRHRHSGCVSRRGCQGLSQDARRARRRSRSKRCASSFPSAIGKHELPTALELRGCIAEEPPSANCSWPASLSKKNASKPGRRPKRVKVFWFFFSKKNALIPSKYQEKDCPMDLRFTPDEIAFRDEMRTFFRENIPADVRDKARRKARHVGKDEWVASTARHERGMVWPCRIGRCSGAAAIGRRSSATSTTRKCCSNERAEPAAVRRPHGRARSSLRSAPRSRRQKYLPRIANIDDWWCQGFSEPGAGSDLANLKTRAVRDGDEWVINGQKTWTTLGQWADWIFVLARTNPEARKPQEGISFILVDMKTPGVDGAPDPAHRWRA